MYHQYDIPTNPPTSQSTRRSCQRARWRLLLSCLILFMTLPVFAADVPLTGVTQLWKGVQSHHSCVLTGWGEVKCWGSNNSGQLGDNSTIDSWIPVTSLISDVTAIATGAEHTCVLTSIGEVKCWGNNDMGQLGDGTITERHIPVDVTGLTAVTVTAIATGTEHTCALTDSGGVKCWGNNMMGQLGDGTTLERHAPVDVAGLTSVTVTAIATGGTDTCVLTSSGGVKCWGQSSGSLTPVDVAGLTDVVDIAASVSHICVLTNTGGVKCWGDNSFGELGVNNSTVYYSTPVDVTGLASDVAAIAVGNFSTCALMTSSGGVKCWGDNSSGQLGDGTTTNRYTPMDVTNLTSGVTAIAAGYIYACALMTSDGGVKCWGLGNSGQLGDGTTTERHTPVDVLEFIDTPPVAYSGSLILSPTADYPNWSVGETLVAGDYSYGDDDYDEESGTLFQWYQATDSSCSTGKTAITGATAQTYTLASSDVGKYICFGVTPKNAYGTGTEVLTTSGNTIIKGNQTISFTPPASGIYGSTATLSATAISGLTVTFASTTTGICTVNVTTVTYVSAGICILTANQAGNVGYNAAPQVTGNIIINGPIVMFDPIQVTTLAGDDTVGYADGTGTVAKFYRPDGVAVDTAGNLYVADTDNNRIRKIVIATGVVTTLAGDGTYGYADGTGTATQFANPSSVAVDTAGNLYVADLYNHRIRKIVLATGVVTTLAGSSTSGFADGTGTAAQFGYLRGVAVDTAGNLYVTDSKRIRKIVLATGVVTTLAGSGTWGYADGTGTAAQFGYLRGVAVDTAGNLYVVDYQNQRIRKIVLATGVVTTLAGTYGYAGGTAAQFDDPSSVAVDTAGNLYVTDSNRISKIVLATGVVTTLAGSTGGSADGTGTAAQFFRTLGVAVDTAGNLYVADNESCIRKIVVTTGVVTTLAGSGIFADGTGTAAHFSSPLGVAVDTAGNLYVADAGYHRIRKIVIATGVVTTLAGSTYSYGDGYADGTGTAAQFRSPTGVAVDTAGNLYVADGYRIRKIVIATGVVTTLVGSIWNGTGTPYERHGIAVDTAGNLYVANYGNNRILKIVIATGVVTTLAGSTQGYADGTGTAAKFYFPRSVAVDTAGNLYVADYGNGRIRKIVIATGVVTTLDGAHPTGVAVDAAGNLYVVEGYRIRKIVIATGVVTTLAGSTDGYADGIGTAALFGGPQDVTIDTAGNLYVTDTGNDRIRKMTPPVFTAFSTSAGTASAAQSFSVSGNSLIANLTVTAPTGYEVSLSSGTGYATSLNVTQVAATIASTLVYIRLSATTGAGTYNGNITLDSADAMQKTLAVTGSVILANQTISFTPPASGTYGGTATLSATATSNLTVTFASTTSTICTVSDTTVSYVSAGTCTLTADQAGNASYNAAPQVAGNVTVGQANQTISFTPPTSGTYGGSAPLSATATSNLTVTFASTTIGICMVNNTTVNYLAVGTCNLTATQAGNANYNAAPQVSGNVTVGQANQTISFTIPPVSHTYGDVSFDLSATTSSGLPVTYTASGTCNVSGATVTITGAGSCIITASQIGDANYNTATAVPQTLTIAKKSITAKVDNVNREVGVANPTFTISYTGLVNGDIATAITTPPTATTAAVMSSPMGSYPITCSNTGSNSTNYVIIGNCDPGTLAVGLASPTFTMSPASGYVSINNPIVVSYSVKVTGTGPTPTGNVTINDGTDTCTDTVAAGQCTLTPTTSGVKTLTATYPSDGNYANATTTATVNVTEVIFTPTGINVAEGGAMATYTVKLATPPATDVTITLTPDAQVMVNPTTLTFTNANGTTAQTVTVTAIDDAVVEGTQTGIINQAITTGDNAGYDTSMSLAKVTATITDNDTLPVVVTPTPVVVTAPSTQEGSTGGSTSTPPLPNQLALFLQVDGTGSGSVSTDTGRVCTRQDCQMNLNGEVNCQTEACREIVNTGDYVTLTPRADGGSVFTNWGGNEDCIDGNVFMNGGKLCIAFFHRIYQLTVTLQGPGQVRGSDSNQQPVIDCGSQCQTSVSDGMRISLQAIPNQGMMFGGWSGECGPSTQNPLILEVSKEMTCQANFSKSEDLDSSPAKSEDLDSSVVTTVPVVSKSEDLDSSVVTTLPVVSKSEELDSSVVTTVPVVSKAEELDSSVVTTVPVVSKAEDLDSSRVVSTPPAVETTPPTDTATPAVVALPLPVATTAPAPEPVTPPVAVTVTPLVTPPPVVTLLPVMIAGVNYSCPTTGDIGEVCNYSGQEVTNLNVQATGIVSNGLLKTTVVNQGWVSNFHITTTGKLSGGVVTGYIQNEGEMLDFDFEGMSIIGGTLGGVITNTSKVGGYFQDVTLLPNTKITGGRLSGIIKGDKNAPALLEGVRVKSRSKLSGVKLGKDVKLEKGVVVEDK